MRYILFLMLWGSTLFAHEEKPEPPSVNEKKAVQGFSEDKGFTLRAGVEERLGVKTKRVDAKGAVLLPFAAMIYSKDENQLFRLRDGYWKAIDVHPKRQKDGYLVISSDLGVGDQVAITNSGLLKVVDLHLRGGEQSGHIH